MERDLKRRLRNGRFQGLTPQRSRIMSSIKGRGNKSTEARFRSAMIRSGIRGWKVCPRGVTGNPDFWFERQKLAVFVDGCFWHACPVCKRLPKRNRSFWAAKFERNARKDARLTSLLKSHGVVVVRYWEHDIRTNPDRCIRKVAAALRPLDGSSLPAKWADHLAHAPVASPDFMENVKNLPVQER